MADCHVTSDQRLTCAGILHSLSVALCCARHRDQPFMFQPHTDIQGQTKCLRAHHEALGTPSPATTPHVAERRKWASDKVQELTATSERGPSSLNKTITIADVEFALNTMKNGKAAGHDGIAVELLKQSGPAGLQMLTAVYNEVLKTHTMPSEWRKGDVVSIFKSGDPTDCGNYRGITLLPVIDKLYMTVLEKRITAHIMLHDHQYGFVRRKGTIEALFNMVATMEAHAGAKDPMLAFFLDVKKAFDTVNRDMLLVKLHEMGITGDVWRSVKASYEQTRNRVKHKGTFSEFYAVYQGVAQGCPLSPILFIIFMNDLQELLHTTCAEHGVTIKFDQQERPYVSQSFADDTSALAEGRTCVYMQKVVDTMYAHSTQWLWDANVLKSNIMACSNGQAMDATPITWGHTDIPFCTEAKSLGLWITHDLTWDKQIASAKRKGKWALSKYRRLLHNTQVKLGLKVHIIKTHIITAMTYAMEVWSPNTPSEHKGFAELEAILDDALKIAVLGTGAYNWRKRRCLKTEVLHHLLGVPTLKAEMSAAHIRLAMKRQTPVRQAHQPQSQHNPDAPNLPAHEDICSLTSAIMTSLNDQHPWKKFTEQQKTVVQGIQEEGVAEALSTEIALEKGRVKAALHQLAARVAYTKVGRGTANGATAATRHSNRACTRKEKTPHIDPLRHVLAQDSYASMTDTRRVLMLSTSSTAAPLLAACSGHLLDDHDEGQCPEDGICDQCGQPDNIGQGPAGSHSSSWHRMWHKVVMCTLDDMRQTKLAVYEVGLLQAAKTAPQYQASIQALFTELHSRHTGVFDIQSKFFALLTDPAGTHAPPQHLHHELIRLTATLLTPEANEHDGAGVLGQEGARPDGQQEQSIDTRRRRDGTQDKGTQSERRQSKRQNSTERGSQSMDNINESTQNCQWQDGSRERDAQCINQARGGRLETPPVDPPYVAPRPMPDGYGRIHK